MINEEEEEDKSTDKNATNETTFTTDIKDNDDHVL